MFGGRRHDRREERHGGGGTYYQMRQRLLSIGDDYWVEDDQGRRVFKVDGKALRLRKALVLEDAQGRTLYKIHEKMLRLRDTMEIEDDDGRRVATVTKAKFTPLRERWTVDVSGGPDLDVTGNVVDHEYRIDSGGSPAAEVSKRWFHLADTYGVQVAHGQNPALMIAITAVLDATAHEAR